MKYADKENELLEAWEATYKKGQLTLWLFLVLKEEQLYVKDIPAAIERLSEGTISCEEQSLYRTLRKYHHLGMVDYETRKGNRGPDRKYYHLTRLGQHLLQRFIDRNIKVFFGETLQERLFNHSPKA